MIAYLRRVFWAWRNRCRPANKLSLSYLPTAAHVASYGAWLLRHFDPCKVCGNRTCRHAVRRATPRRLTPEHRALLARTIRACGGGECLVRAAFE